MNLAVSFTILGEWNERCNFNFSMFTQRVRVQIRIKFRKKNLVQPKKKTNLIKLQNRSRPFS